MAQYTFRPSTFLPSDLTGLSADWDVAANWSTLEIPNSAGADVELPPLTTEGAPLTFDVVIKSGESYVVHSLAITNNTLTVDGALSVGAALALDGWGSLEIAGDLTTGDLSSAAGTFIQGSGTITSTGSLENGGNISGSGLTLDVASFRNDGTLEASNGDLQVDVAATAGAFANLSGGTLTGGTYEAGSGHVLALNVGSDITTLAAKVQLFGGTIETAETPGAPGHSLVQTLRTIAHGGDLQLSGDFVATAPLVVAGVVNLQGTLDCPGLTIRQDGLVYGKGSITGPITNDGMLETDAFFGELHIGGPISGSGTIALSTGLLRGGSVEITSSATNTVNFSGYDNTLVIDTPSLFTGTIAGFSVSAGWHSLTPLMMHGGPFYGVASDTIVLKGIDLHAVTGRQYTGTSSGGTLTLQTAAGTTSLAFAGAYTLADFVIAAGPQASSTDPPSLQITMVMSPTVAAADATQAAFWPNVVSVSVRDTVANVLASLDSLESVARAGKLVTITVSDAATLAPSFVQRVADADALAKLGTGCALVSRTGEAVPSRFIDDTAEGEVICLYQAAFGRTPDATGITWWAHALHAGDTPAHLAAGLMASPERLKIFRPTADGGVRAAVLAARIVPTRFWQGASSGVG